MKQASFASKTRMPLMGQFSTERREGLIALILGVGASNRNLQLTESASHFYFFSSLKQASVAFKIKMLYLSGEREVNPMRSSCIIKHFELIKNWSNLICTFSK